MATSRRFIVRWRDTVAEVEVTADGHVKIDGRAGEYRVEPAAGGGLRVTDGNRNWEVFAAGRADVRQVFSRGELWEMQVSPEGGRAARGSAAHADSLTAPMPATLTKLLVEPGSEVHRGDIVMKLEAMKMELPVRAPRDGRVKTVRYREGDLVEPGVALLELE